PVAMAKPAEASYPAPVMVTVSPAGSRASTGVTVRVWPRAPVPVRVPEPRAARARPEPAAAVAAAPADGAPGAAGGGGTEAAGGTGPTATPAKVTATLVVQAPSGSGAPSARRVETKAPPVRSWGSPSSSRTTAATTS